MPKGGNQRFSDARGVREVPLELAQKFEKWLADPSIIDQLPENRRLIARQQLAGYRALLERRRATALAGHATRRALQARQLPKRDD